MINLLPSKEKEKILLDQEKKLIIILWILVLFFIFSFILILFSIKFYIQGQAEYQKIILQELEEEFKKSETQNLQKEINSINSILTKLNNFYESKIYLSETLEEISDTLLSGTYLNSLSVNPSDINGKTYLKVTLSGFAPTREILFDFKKNLERKSNFEEVYFPPANWVKSNDIDFFVTFKVIKLQNL